MGATKKTQFSSQQIDLATLGKAIASPARIAILQYLKSNNFASNKELCTILKLSKTSVHQHLKVLYLANLVNETFIANFHGYYLEKSAIESLEKLNDIFDYQ